MKNQRFLDALAAHRSRRKMPSLPQQAVNVTVAKIKDITAGRPRRDQAEIDRIVQICRSCPQLIPERDRCSLCGCPVLKKIPMARESCPEGRW